MRKIISLSLGVALASTVFVAVPASADPAAVVRDHPVFGDHPVCGIAGANSSGELVGDPSGVLTHVVQNDHHAVMTCKGDAVVNDSGRTQHYSGFACGVYLPGGGYTHDGRLTCHSHQEGQGHD